MCAFRGVRVQPDLLRLLIARCSSFRRAAFAGSFVFPNFQHIETQSANRASSRAKDAILGKTVSNRCSKRCSRRQVAIPDRTSASTWQPHFDANCQIASGSVSMKVPTSIIACQRGSISEASGRLSSTDYRLPTIDCRLFEILPKAPDHFDFLESEGMVRGGAYVVVSQRI